MIGSSKHNKLPKIIVIEGFWGVGKSTIITNIRKSYPVLFIPEPNYINAGITSNISGWYRNQHNERMELAKKYINYGESVILERSILSSVAFYYAEHGIVPEWFSPIGSKLKSLPNLHFFFLHNDRRSFLKSVPEIKDKSVRTAVLKNKAFYDNYLTFFTKVAPELIGAKITSIEISNDLYQPLDGEKYVKKILDNRHPCPKRKLKEVKVNCASAVIFHKDKFLLLYSNKHNHFSLPQGHQNNGEKITATALREITEETGFNDLKIIKPITTYSIRFYDKGKITNKIITCFLVELSSLKKTKKALESHESYTNHFFTIEAAVKKLNWAEDKEMFRNAQKIIIQMKNPASLEKRD